jgi:hypothetical protein
MAFHPLNRYLHREFKRSMQEHYDLKYLGLLGWFLRIRVVRDTESRKLRLIQDAALGYLENAPKYDHWRD